MSSLEVARAMHFLKAGIPLDTLSFWCLVTDAFGSNMREIAGDVCLV